MLYFYIKGKNLMRLLKYYFCFRVNNMFVLRVLYDRLILEYELEYVFVDISNIVMFFHVILYFISFRFWFWFLVFLFVECGIELD